MPHVPSFIHDLAIILITAAIVTILFKKLKQPLVLGYLAAGFLISPQVPFLPSITDQQSTRIWAEIGLIFLLFTLGLEFSFRKLMKVGTKAVTTALFEVISMFSIGFLTGKLFGWDLLNSVFLGAVLSISSTTIIYKAFEELGVSKRRFAHLVYGILIIEDLVAILLLVFLATLAVSRQFEGIELLYSGAKLLFFLGLWFVVGIFAIPTFLKKARPFMNEETTTVVSIGLCLLMVIVATEAGFSPALGAFIMGSILAETKDADKIRHTIEPIKSLFGAVFFVSVGMLIDPVIIYENWNKVLILSMILIFGKFISVTIGSLLSREPLQRSIYVGLSLTQIGEFSFIIATLGENLQVINRTLYPIAVSVSAITTFSTPYLIRFGPKMNSLIEKILPDRIRSKLENYSINPKEINHNISSKFVIRNLLNIVLTSSLIVAIKFSIKKFMQPIIATEFPDFALEILLILTIFICTPFLWGLIFDRKRKNTTENKPLEIIFNVVRGIVAAFLLGFILWEYVSATYAVTFALIFMATFAFFTYKHIETTYRWFQGIFEKNLNETTNRNSNHKIAPWDAHLVELHVSPDSPMVRKNLSELSIREKYSISIALIERGTQRIIAPGRSEHLYPFDKIFVIGTDEQIQRFQTDLNTKAETADDPIEITLEPAVVKKDSPFNGKSIRESGIRERTEGMIVGIERQGKRLLNPDSLTILQENDLLWIVGNKTLISRLK